jgi:lantibiotic transport system permease protein
MSTSLFHSVQIELLKTRRSAASWLVIIGGSLVPFILLLAQFMNAGDLPARNVSPQFWEFLFYKSWQMMAFFLLPMGIVLATSLVSQLEYKNNAWKLLYSTPQKLSSIFFAKLLVILVMMLKVFIIFNIGIYLAGVIPSLLLPKVFYPKEALPFLSFLRSNGLFFIDCLPIIGLQYLVSLKYKNFLVSVGIGLGLIIACMFALSWEYGYIFPYAYTSYQYLNMVGDNKLNSRINIHLLATVYFIIFTVISYLFFITKKEKG